MASSITRTRAASTIYYHSIRHIVLNLMSLHIKWWIVFCPRLCSSHRHNHCLSTTSTSPQGQTYVNGGDDLFKIWNWMKLWFDDEIYIFDFSFYFPFLHFPRKLLFFTRSFWLNQFIQISGNTSHAIWICFIVYYCHR